MKTPTIGLLPRDPLRVAFLLVALLAASCGPRTAPSAGDSGEAPPAAAGEVSPAASTTAGDALFVDAAVATGLEHMHWNGMAGEYNYPEMMGSGAALIDYDGDGDLDVYLVQGNPLGDSDGSRAVHRPPGPLPLTDRLFRNDLVVEEDGSRHLRFTDVTEESAIVASGYGMGVAAADFDDDGHVDLYVTSLGANQLLLNNGPDLAGRVTFTDATASSGTADPRWSVPAAVGDYDGDGRLDLYVGNYVEWSHATNPRCTDELGMANYCGPLAFEPQADVLYRNRGRRGDARVVFEDVTREAGLGGKLGGALGVVTADFNGDGRLDLYVGNDGLPNQLWMNQGGATFEDQALLAGCAVNATGQPEASMGMSAADFDGDGDEDLFVTHLGQETNTVYVNDGHGLFDDRSVETGLGSPSWSYTGFGTAWFDYDNDGWLDLLAVNGAVKVIKEQALAGDTLPLRQRNQLFHNLGDGLFEEVTDRAGEVFEARHVSRGAAFGDVDNDGDIDVVVTNNSGPAQLLLNQVGQDRHWLGLRLVVAAGAGVRDAWGARVRVTTAGGRELVRRVGATASYASSSDPRLVFGLGDEASVTAVVVRWPDGRGEEWRDLEVGRYTTLRQGSGRAVVGGGP